MATTRIAHLAARILVFLLFTVGTTLAVAPTEEAIAKWRLQGVLEQKAAEWQAFKAAGGCSPSQYPALDKAKHAAKLAANPNAVDTINVVVLLVDFSDFPYDGVINQSQTGTVQKFDSILFSDRRVDPVYNSSGSMTDYYLENSYGSLYVHGEIYGWYRMPQTYSYYTGTDNGLTLGRTLARDAVTAANNDVDYSKFANASNMVSVVIIHAGHGAEETGAGIWSHKSTVAGTPTYDGVVIWDYTLNPEEFGTSLSPIGVFCHEFGHVLGLPDLYDTNINHPESEGLGRWSLMASGNYNGDGRYPSHLDAWCKRELLFVPGYTTVTSNLYQAPIPAVEFNPTIYMLPDTNLYPKEYWLVENRQRIGFDYGLPADGLCIYHIDNTVADNTNPLRYKVALEQADGLNQLALSGSRGDAGDPWPGDIDKHEFTDVTTPNTRTYAGAVTQVGVWRISNSDSVMYADMDYVWSRPRFELYSTDSLVVKDTVGTDDGDGKMEPGETIDFYCTVRNYMRHAYQYTVSLSTDNPDIEFIANNVSQGNLTLPNTLTLGQKSQYPVRFKVRDGAKGVISKFTLTIHADSANSSGDRKFAKSWDFDLTVGAPQILLVDDDNGQNHQQEYVTSLLRLRLPCDVWNKSTQGSPTATALNRYPIVFWVHGEKPTGTLTTADVTALKGFLNNGGNLAMGSVTAAVQLKTLDSVFMRDYLHARYIDSLTTSAFYFWGVNGAALSEGLAWSYYLSKTPTEMKHIVKLDPTAGGQVVFETSALPIPGYGYLGHCGIAYQGTYKTVFTSFALEFISDYSQEIQPPFTHRDTLFAHILKFFNGSATSVDDNTPFNLPKAFALEQNYPNPFNPSTTIQYDINYSGRPEEARLRTVLTVFNLAGQRVRTLVDKVEGPGNYRVEWNGNSDSGEKVASGVYLYRLTRGNTGESKKMVLLK